MFDELMQLNVGDALTIDNDETRQLTSEEDFQVSAADIYETEGGEIVVINLGDYFLVGHAFSGSPKYFIYELYDEGEGLYCKKDSFTSKISIESGQTKTVYRRTEAYMAEDAETSFAEYRSESYFEYILLRRAIDNVEVLRGFEISETDIVI